MRGMKTNREYLKDKFNYLYDDDFEEFMEILSQELEYAKERIQSRRQNSNTIFLDI
jgi:hypothetical protein